MRRLGPLAAIGLVCGSAVLGAQGVTSVSGSGFGDHVASLITVADPAIPSLGTPAVGYNDPRYQSPYGTGFDGVARLLMTNGQGFVTSGCTGTLLWTGQDVLTAAHCVTTGSNVVTASSVYSGFLNPTGGVTNIKSSAIYVNPAYNGGLAASPNGSAIDPNDIAIIHLSRPADSWMTGYYIYGGDPTGQPTIFAGFGLTGNGITGGTVNTLFDDVLGTGEPVRRLALNEWDETLTADASSIYSGFATPILLSDFDDGTLGNNTLCNFFGGPGNPAGLPQEQLANVCDPGYGIYEGMIGSGDSGGPGFIWDAAMGRYEVAGVASFGTERCWNPNDGSATNPNPDGSCPANYELNGSYFGSYAGHVDPAVGANFAFIASATPEPSSIVLLATGLFAFAPAVVRRRRPKV
jgi:trypsin